MIETIATIYCIGMMFYWRCFIRMAARQWSRLGWHAMDTFVMLYTGIVWPIMIWVIFGWSVPKFRGPFARCFERECEKNETR